MPTFPEVNGLEDVGFVDTIVLSSLQELGYLLHLLKGHLRSLDLLHRALTLRIQPINELTQHLGTQVSGRGGSHNHAGVPTSRPILWDQGAKAHRAIFEPVLEILTARLRPTHIFAALARDPLDQDLFQVRVILLLDLLLHLTAQAIGRSPVGHG